MQKSTIRVKKKKKFGFFKQQTKDVREKRTNSRKTGRPVRPKSHCTCTNKSFYARDRITKAAAGNYSFEALFCDYNIMDRHKQ